MRPEVYELVALFMRYWFVFLMLMIVFRCGKWLYNERKKYLRTLRYLPDAGLIGEALDVETGKAYPLPREGVIGSGRHADIRIRTFRHLRVYFELEEGVGVRLEPVGRHSYVRLDGEEIHKEGYALHQSLMETSCSSVRFRLFEGVNVPSATRVYEQSGDFSLDEPEDAWVMDDPLPQTFPPPEYYYQAYPAQAYPAAGDQTALPPMPPQPYAPQGCQTQHTAISSAYPPYDGRSLSSAYPDDRGYAYPAPDAAEASAPPLEGER